jgi:hypothetical protein
MVGPLLLHLLTYFSIRFFTDAACAVGLFAFAAFAALTSFFCFSFFFFASDAFSLFWGANLKVNDPAYIWNGPAQTDANSMQPIVWAVKYLAS